MGNSSSSEWSQSIKFGNHHRDVAFFYKQFGISTSSTIIDVKEVKSNEIAIVVNKVIWYGIRLVIYDPRFHMYDDTRPNRDHYEMIQITGDFGIKKEEVDGYITKIINCFVGSEDEHVCTYFQI